MSDPNSESVPASSGQPSHTPGDHWRRAGATVYRLNEKGTNHVWFRVYPGHDDNGRPVSEAVAEFIADYLVGALNDVDFSKSAIAKATGAARAAAPSAEGATK